MSTKFFFISMALCGDDLILEQWPMYSVLLLFTCPLLIPQFFHERPALIGLKFLGGYGADGQLQPTRV